VEEVTANLDDPHTLAAAFDGIDNVFLLNAVGPNETEEGLIAVSAAKAGKITKVVDLSVCMPEGSSRTLQKQAPGRECNQGVEDRLYGPPAEQFLPKRLVAKGCNSAT
jgi:hypothetical protein